LVRWFKVLKHNPTEFVGNLDGLLAKGLEYRAETLQKLNETPNLLDAQGNTIMSMCIKDHGYFKGICDNPEEGKLPNEHDYFLHLIFGLLIESCSNDSIPSLVPRIILNNLAINISEGKFVLQIPRH
jgi:hypothetical protein